MASTWCIALLVVGLGRRAEAYGRPFERVYELMIVGAIVFGYIAQRLIEGIFVRRGMHIHVWQQVDGKFHLVTARRNNGNSGCVSWLAGRSRIELVALWTLLSLIFMPFGSPGKCPPRRAASDQLADMTRWWRWSSPDRGRARIHLPKPMESTSRR